MITLTKPALDALSLDESTPEKSIDSGAWKVTGKPEVGSAHAGHFGVAIEP